MHLLRRSFYRLQFYLCAGVAVDVVKVEYLGAYPSLGVHYSDESQPNLDLYCERKIKELLEEKSVFYFISFVLNYEKPWNDFEKFIMGSN